MKKYLWLSALLSATALIAFSVGIIFGEMPSDGEAKIVLMDVPENISKPSSPDIGRININEASELELTDIPGIGISTAEKIIKYRESEGGFETLEELMNVHGIGEKTLEKMKPYITLGDTEE